MNNKCIDYSQIAESYDRLRTLSDGTLAEWICIICDLTALKTDGKLLDVGCGTGRFTIPLAEHIDGALYGIDPSSDMLTKALEKKESNLVGWAKGSGESLPFQDGAFNCVFMSFTIQHFKDRERAIDEAYRVLLPGGRLLIMTTSHGQFRRSSFHYFPKLLDIDLKRFPSLPELERLLLDCGFTSVSSSSSTRAQSYLPVESLLNYVEEKPISTFALLSDNDFENGFEEYEQILREEFGSRVPYWEEYSFVVGEKK